MTDQIESMPNQSEFDSDYNKLNNELEKIFTEYSYLGNVVLLALCSECLHGIVNQRNLSISDAKLELIKFITSLQFIDNSQMN